MSKNKARGTAWESAIVAYLQANGFPYAERRALRGNKDAGDITGVPGIAIEAKNHKSLDLGTWFREAEVGARNAAVRWFAVWHKRRQSGVANSYVTIPAWLFVELLRDDEKDAS